MGVSRTVRYAPAGRAIVVAMSLWAGSSVAVGQTVAVSVRERVYDETQATAGQALYYAHCLSCHGEDLAGLDQSPPLAGPEFTGIWAGESLAALANRIATMPPTRPDSLAAAEVAALLAYMLWFNGLPPGDQALDADRATLESIVFEPAPLP